MATIVTSGLHPSVAHAKASPYGGLQARDLHSALGVDAANDNAALLGQWKDIFAADNGACPAQHPEWVAAEPRKNQAILLQEWEGAQLSALGMLLPKTLRTRKFTGPGLSFNLRGMRLVGNRFLQRSDDREQLQRMADSALARVRETRCDFLLVEDLDRRLPLTDVLDATVRKGWQLFAPGGYQARLRIVIPTTAEEYWKKFSSKTRNTFRRKLKKFGETRLTKIVRPEEIPGFLATAKAISKQTWQTRQMGLRVGDSPTQIERFSAAARAGLFRSYLWFVDNEAVAFLIGNQSHGVFHYEEVGYATSFAKYSPGQIMLTQVIDELFTQDRPDVLDFGGGDAPYKRLFANSTSESRTLWLLRPGLRRSLVLSYVRTYATMMTRARRWIAGTSLGTKLRQRVRYAGAAQTPSDDEPPED